MTAPNPLIAERQDSTRIWSGITLVEGIVDVKHGIESGSWVSTNIGTGFVAIDGALLVMDPVGSLLSWGVAWCIEHIKPLTDALDWLAGDPDQIAANAQTWANIAAHTKLAADDLNESVHWEIAGWSGHAADAYRAAIETEHVALQGLAESAAAKSAAVQMSGNVVLVVRTLVRDLIADLVSILVLRIPQWTAEMGLTLGIATPWVVGQVSALAAKWSLKISTLLYDLIDSLRRLLSLVRQVDQFTAALNARPRGTHHYYPGDPTNPHHRDIDTEARPEVSDPSMQYGPLGTDHQPGVVDPHGLFLPKEQTIADRLAEEGIMVHARVADHTVHGQTNPDAMVRFGPEDPGTLAEFKTLKSADSTAVQRDILKAGRQVDPCGGGIAVIDGRNVGLAEQDALRGYARAVGQAQQHGQPMPDQVLVVLGDGSIITLPDR